MATVQLKGIGKVYEGGVRAVDNANIDIQDREFVVLVGPSGCGKSTTLRMIAGLEDITEGELYIDGKQVNDVPPKDRDIAMVFQNYALYPHMSVYDNMAFGLKIRKFDKAEIEKRVREAARILDIEELLDRKPKALSGGQRQRVAVGRAIVRQPKVFLFDEPLSNLDAKLRVQMRAEISGLHHRLKATMIYVTHDQVEAMTMADKIVVMKNGIIQQIGNPLTLYNKPANRFVAGFIGSPPMNFMTVKIVEEGKKLLMEEADFKAEIKGLYADLLREKGYVGKEVVFGIRPEDLAYETEEKAGITIKGEIGVIEPLGAETQVWVNTQKHQLIAKLDPDIAVKVGQQIFFTPNYEKANFFDLETENTIRKEE
ncbi:ABC transporter ATP-binding protein [Sediminispirochaeta smaragdinae]|jgi:multiple sugar transport system ATP-binding protein|uniref:ABC transporter related protein n=1 Tax=Sediminispirochaeta smaragdinae (strain DSM 11293 / JCM 15392 / SEBR 4228) TaxID=573413 RepID=E1RBJ4_SEDSS|nr:sn-glycerol-3-phosphate ABC transporter ATP-binding protein UgpC [Sediminispirochaeta smaragdinae]ADK79724.1 ABC transporter related protein [Sediminispirochaeta smaragdinae DSM 11293]